MKHSLLSPAAMAIVTSALTFAPPGFAPSVQAAPAATKPAAVTKAAPVIDRTAPLQFIEDEAEAQCNLSFTLHAEKSGRLSVLFDYRDAKNFYAADFAPGSVTLRAVINGKTQQLAQNAVSLPASSRITLQRRRWTMRLVAGPRVLATAYDATFDSGKIGSVSNGGWGWSDPSVQPVEDIFWSDDFTRLPGENGDWKANASNWQLTSSSEDSASGGSRHHDLATRIGMSSNPVRLSCARHQRFGLGTGRPSVLGQLRSQRFGQAAGTRHRGPRGLCSGREELHRVFMEQFGRAGGAPVGARAEREEHSSGAGAGRFFAAPVVSSGCSHQPRLR
jgi:hypothetical protein